MCTQFLFVQMYDRAISAPTSPTKMEQTGKRSWEEPAWMGSSPRVLNNDMKSTVSRSLQSLPTSSHAFEPGEENSDFKKKIILNFLLRHRFQSLFHVVLCNVDQSILWFRWLTFYVLTDSLFGGILLFLYSGCTVVSVVL